MTNAETLDFLKFFLPLGGAVFAWFVNERRRRAWEEYERKEERYRELLVALRGFYVPTQDSKLKQTFLDQVNMCWLYCSDEVIQKAYAFLATVDSRTGGGVAEQEKALGEFVLAVRQDLLARRIVKHTRLTAADFKNLSAT